MQSILTWTLYRQNEHHTISKASASHKILHFMSAFGARIQALLQKALYLPRMCAAHGNLSPRHCAFAGSGNVDSLFAAAPYRGILRVSFLNHKFFRQEAFYEIFAGFLIRAIEPVIGQLQIDLVLPVPLSAARMRERGYNQAGLLARNLAAHFEIDYTENAVFRIRNTAKQSLLLPHERQKNVENAFLADREKVAGKRILLIDDIFTFGATMDACAKSLLDAGAKSVNAAVLFKTISRNKEND